MALNPQIDPAIAAQLYGLPAPSLADMAPAVQESPWSWVPESWNTPSAADLNQALAPQIDPAVVPMPAPDPLAMPALPPIGPTRDPTQPGLGIPASALDAALPAAPPPPAPEPGIELPFAQPPPIQDLPSVRDRPPVPDVDATTGAAPLPEAAQQKLTGEQAFRKAVADNIGDPLAIPDDAQRQRAVNELALRDPAGFAELQFKHAAAREKEIGAKRLEIANKDYEQQQANLLARQEADKVSRAKAEELLADAQRIAATKEDPTGGLSGGQRIAGVLGAIIGGLVQGRTGAARNAGLDALNEQINRGIAAQRANMANQREGIALRRSALADEFARHGDDYRSAEAVRLAALKHADDLLATEQQNYDPKGSTALKIAGLRAGIAAQQQQAIQAYKQKKFENSLKLQDAARAQQIADETARNNRAQNYLRGQEIKGAAEERQLQRDSRAEDRAQKRADEAAERSRQFSIGGIPRVQVGPDDKPVLDANGKPVIVQDKLRQSTGEEFQAASPEERKVLREKKTAGFNAMRNIDRIVAIRDRVGGESGLFNSDERQELEGLAADTTMQIKAGTQGMSSDSDMAYIKQSAGVDNTTSWRAQRAKLIAARARIEANLNQAYGDSGYDGERIAIPPGSLGKAPDTPEEIKNQRLFEKPDISFNDAAKRDLADRQIAAGKENGLDANNPEDQRLIAESYAATRADWDPGAAPFQQRRIRELGAAARGDDANARAARVLLGQLAEDGQTDKLRSLARAELEGAARASAATPEQTTTSSDTPARRRSGPTSQAVTVPPDLTLGGR